MPKASQRSSSSPATFIIFHLTRQFRDAIPLLPAAACSRLNYQQAAQESSMSSRAPLCRPAILLVTLLSSTSAVIAQQASNERPREHFQNAEVIYDWVRDLQGNQLRILVTRPKVASGKAPVIVFVGWLSCDSVEYTRGETDGFGAIFWRVIETSGFATLRMDKEGVGESAGDCSKTDFLTELSGYRAGFKSLGNYPFIDL